MNNKLIALAVAGAFAAPMAAQAAPTVYGIGQVEFAQTSNSLATRSDQNHVVDNKMGRFGFKGSEDLGEGLKALYTLEFGIETSNNANPGNTIFERETSIGLKIGTAHEIRMGNIKSPYKYLGGVAYDSFVATSLQAREGSTNITDAAETTTKTVNLTGGAMSSGAYGHGAFLQNAVSYVGDFKPVKVWVAYSPDDTFNQGNGAGGNGDQQSGNATAGPVTSLGIKANIGAFEFGAASIQKDGCDKDVASSNCGSNSVNGGIDVTEIKSTKLFAAWSKGQHTVRAQVETREAKPGDPTAAAAVDGTYDTDYQYLNYQFKMGKHLVDVAVGTKDDKRTTKATDTDWSRLAYAYNFSKQTRVFAGVATSDLSNNKAGAAAPNDWDTFSVGMTVKF